MPGAGCAAAAVSAKKKEGSAIPHFQAPSPAGTEKASSALKRVSTPDSASEGPDKVLSDGDKMERVPTGPNRRFDAMDLEEEEEEVHVGAAKFVHSKVFSNTVTLCILIGAVQMGAQADISDPSIQWLWDIFEQVFTVVFAVEMGFKIYVFRKAYFFDPWNILDFVISWISIVGAWIIPLSMLASGDSGDDSSASLGVLRVFRLLRLFRILKIMKAVPELRMVIEGIAASLRAMFWVCMLLFIVIYMFSIYCVEILGREEAGFPGYTPTTESILTSKFYVNFNSWEYFGNIPRAMLSLFGVTLLAEYDIIRPVWECHRFSVVLFVLLIFLTSFGIVNVIIGVIVERTTSSMAEMERESEMKRHEEAQAHIIQLSEIVWARTDSDGSGTISREEMAECAGSSDIVRLFKSLDWPKGWTLDDLHMMLDTDGGGELSKSEFCDGMHRLIFGNDFQKACMNMLTAGQIKQVSNDIKAVTTEEVVLLRQAMADIQASLATVLAEVRGMAGSSEPCPAKPSVSLEVRQTVDIQKEMARQDMAHALDVPTVVVTSALRNAMDHMDTAWTPLPADVGAAPEDGVVAQGQFSSEVVDGGSISSASAGSSWRRRGSAGKSLPKKLRSAGAHDDAQVPGSCMQQIQTRQNSRTWRCAAEGPLGICSAEDSITQAPVQNQCSA